MRSAAPALPDRDLLAAQALGFLATDDARLSRFMAVTSLTAASIRAVAAEPGFADAVLAHLASSDELLTAFAEVHGYDAEAVGRASQPRWSDDG